MNREEVERRLEALYKIEDLEKIKAKEHFDPSIILGLLRAIIQSLPEEQQLDILDSMCWIKAIDEWEYNLKRYNEK